MWFSGMLIKFLNTMCIANALSLTTPIKNAGRSSNNHMITREAESLLANEEIKPLGIKGDPQKEENTILYSIHLVSLPEHSDTCPRSLCGAWK